MHVHLSKPLQFAVGISLLIQPGVAHTTWTGPGSYILFNKFSGPLEQSNGTSVVMRRFLIAGPFADDVACFRDMRLLNSRLASKRLRGGFSCERLNRQDDILDSARARELIMNQLRP